VVLSRIDSVHADDVCVKLLEVGDISSAGVAIGKRVGVFGVGACRAVRRVILLVCNTLEITVILLESYSWPSQSRCTYNCEPLFV
jgi:hypothetical protein